MVCRRHARLRRRHPRGRHDPQEHPHHLHAAAPEAARAARPAGDAAGLSCEALAIKRALATGKDEGISESDLLISLEAEYGENDIFPPTDITEDWLHLIDHDAENVVKVSPFRPGGDAGKTPSPIV